MVICASHGLQNGVLGDQSWYVGVTSIGRERVRRYGAGRERRFQE
jgi:hypothetical protein